jgi:F-type H+-transporting ATPase subunit alpha
LEAFAKFGSDLDAATIRVLDKGRKNVELLKQGQYQPMRLEHMIAVIYCGTKELLRKVPVEKLKAFESQFIELMEMQYRETLNSLRSGNLSADDESNLRQAAAEVAGRFS